VARLLRIRGPHSLGRYVSTLGRSSVELEEELFDKSSEFLMIVGRTQIQHFFSFISFKADLTVAFMQLDAAI
jgi:hypothetical protein